MTLFQTKVSHSKAYNKIAIKANEMEILKCFVFIKPFLQKSLTFHILKVIPSLSNLLRLES